MASRKIKKSFRYPKELEAAIDRYGKDISTKDFIKSNLGTSNFNQSAVEQRLINAKNAKVSTPPNAAGLTERIPNYQYKGFTLGEGSPMSSIPKGQNLVPYEPISTPSKPFNPTASTINYGIKSSPIIEGTAPSNYNPLNINYKSALTAGLPNIQGVRQVPISNVDLSIGNSLKQFGSNISNLAKTSTPVLKTIGSGLKFVNKAFPVVNLGLESMGAASDISANPQMDILDKLSRYGEAAGNSFGIPLPEMANSTVNMLTGLDQETASQKLAREQGDKTNYQYAVGAMSESDANNLATGQDNYTKNHPIFPLQMINRNSNTQVHPIPIEPKGLQNINTAPTFTPIEQPSTIENLPKTQYKTNILGEQISMDQLPKGVGYVNGKLFDSNKQSTQGMFNGYSKERDAALDSYGKVDKNSEFYKRNKKAMENLQ